MFGQGLATLAAQNNTLSDDKKVDSTDLYGGFPLQFSGEEKLKLDDLYRPENMEIMRNYITDVSGKQAERYTDNQVHEMFLTRMRDFETSDVGIIDEGFYITKANDKQRANAGKAYMLYDNLSSVFTSGSTLDAIFGVAEHLKNIFNPFESPSTYAGVGVGKIVTVAGGKTAAQAIKATAKKYAKDAISKQGGLTALKQSGKHNLKKQIVDQSFKKATNNYAKKQALVAVGVDMFTAGSLDYIYQNARVKANAQEEVSGLQVGLSALTGIVGGSVEWLRISRGTNKTTASYNRDFIRDWRTKNAQTPVDREAIDNRIVKDIETWAEKVKRGKNLKDALRGESDAPWMLGNSVTTQFWEAILVGNSKQGVSGIAKIMQEEGFLARLTPDDIDPDGKLKGFTDKFTSLFIDSAEDGGMSQKAKDRITKALTDVGVFDEMKRATVDATGKPVLVDDISKLAAIFASDVQEGGKTLNLASRLAKIAKGDNSYLRAKFDEQSQVAQLKSTNMFGKYLNAFKNNAMWMQNVWRRTVVSALQTSVLNLKGYKAATAINAFADVMLIPIEYTVALSKLAMGNKEGALRNLQRTKDIRENQIERLRNFLDPNSTKQMFEDLMKVDKRTARVLDKAISGGLEGISNLEEVAKKFDLNLENKVQNVAFKTVEGYANAAQKLMLVDTVDKFMKSQAYLGNLDMAIRENITGMNFKKLSQLSQRELSEILVSEEFVNATIQATNVTLSDIFSKSYRYVGGTDSVLGKTRYLTDVAGLIERWGNIPILGTAFPFGKFFNNTVALTYDVIGGGQLELALKLFTAGKVDYTLKRRASKGFIGGGVGAAIYGTTTALSAEEDKSALLETAGSGLMLKDPLKLSTTDKEDDSALGIMDQILAGAVNFTGLGNSLERDLEKQRLGLNWNEELKTNGSIIDITYDFPASQYALAARLINLKKQSREALPKELVSAATEQFLFGQLSRNLGKFGNIGPLFGDILDAESDGVSSDRIKKLLARGPGSLASASISGLFRPADVANRIAGYWLGEEAEIKDAKQGDTLMYDSGRYLHNIFEILNGDSNLAEKREMTREGKIYPTSPASDIFSERTLQPKTYTELALSDVNLKGWAQQLKSYYPEGVSLFNEAIAPVLERKFERFVTSSFYKGLPYDKKLRRVKGILSETKAQIKERMLNGSYGEDSPKMARAKYIMDIADTKTSIRSDALENLNLKKDLSTDDLTNLPISTLSKIVRQIKLIQKQYRLERQGRQ